MTYGEKASALHNSGYNCAQSIVGAFADLTGIDEKRLIAIAGGFGGGMRSGEMCGAVSGAIMILGILSPYDNSSDMAARERIAMLTREFTKRFRERFSYLRCEDLLKSNGQRNCDGFIRGAAEILAEIIETYIKGEVK